MHLFFVQIANCALKNSRYSVVAAMMFLLAGCSGANSYFSFLSASGPKTSAYSESAISTPDYSSIQVVDITDSIARKLSARQRHQLFSELFTVPQNNTFKVGPGDVLDISVWEAPPAALFSTGAAYDPKMTALSARVNFTEQVISEKGTITFPFLGLIKVSGRTLQQIESDIAQGLNGKANQPQVLVRLVKNTTSNVTLVGEMGGSTRMPLTPMGEHLLDALAAAGGVRQPVSKITIQVTRGSSVYALPMEIIIQDPRQNILLQPGDVITALYQPLSFTALGATGKNEEINFEAQGISLAQSLARSGGLQDARADAKGLFIFRFEDNDALEWPKTPVTTTPDNRVPVVYHMNLRDPASFLVAQNFPVKNKDVLYVSNAPAAELQKFLTILMNSMYPALSLFNITK